MADAITQGQPGEIDVRRITEARSLLSDLRFDDRRSSRMSALVLLALAKLGPDDNWSEAAAPLLTVADIMAWIRDSYGINYAPNTRETIRRYTLQPFIESNLVAYNPDNPDVPATAPRARYQLRPQVLPVIQSMNSGEARRAVNKFLDDIAAAESLGRDLADRVDVNAVIAGLASQPAGLIAAEAAVIGRRRAIIAQLSDLAVAADSKETDMQEILEQRHWVFGGQYIGIAERRDLMPMQQHDIPLIAADLSLTIVELKSPGTPLIRRARKNHLVVSNSVNEAVGQCMNYLRTLDEMALPMRTLHRDDQGLDYDYRRSRAIVVIGHQDRSSKDVATRQQVEQTLRTYNSHLSRVQVLTYADLLDAAERALQFDA